MSFLTHQQKSIMTASDVAAIEQMWELKCDHKDHFAHAIMTDSLERPDIGVFIPAGTTVLVTVVSRLGHVCLRHTDVNDIRHGYCVGSAPEDLHDYKLVDAKAETHRQEASRMVREVRVGRLATLPDGTVAVVLAEAPVKRNARGNRKRR